MLKKGLVISFVMIGVFTVGMASAAKKNDFCQADYDRILKGERNFVKAELEGANFQGMDLTGVDFSEAELDRANFKNANLANVNFTNAELDEANLSGANIKGAIFKNTELEYATWIDGRVCGEGSVDGCW